MNTLPPITVSTTDRDRLFAVLDNFKGESDQIDYLYDELARAHIVEADAMTDDVVTLGSRLRFRNEATKHSQSATPYPFSPLPERRCWA